MTPQERLIFDAVTLHDRAVLAEQETAEMQVVDENQLSLMMPWLQVARDICAPMLGDEETRCCGCNRWAPGGSSTKLCRDCQSDFSDMVRTERWR